MHRQPSSLRGSPFVLLSKTVAQAQQELQHGGEQSFKRSFALVICLSAMADPPGGREPQLESPTEGDDDSSEDGELLPRSDFDPEIGSWVYRTLQKVQPGAEITVGSVKASCRGAAGLALGPTGCPAGLRVFSRLVRHF